MNNIEIFLINLDKRPDRLKYVSDQLNRLGLSFTRIKAIDGSLLDEDYSLIDKDDFLIQMGKHVTKGEIGCAESHRLIWKNMIEKNISFALVIEDDVDINSLVVNFLRSDIYKKLDFINLSYTRPFDLDEDALLLLRENKISSRPFIFTKWKKIWKRLEGRLRRRIFELSFLPDNITVCECDPAPILASGYIVSLKGATAFLEVTNSLSFPVDYTWRYCSGMIRQAFLANPLIIQSLEDSNISGRTQIHKMKKKEKIKRLLLRDRRIKRKLNLVKMYGWKIL